MFQGNQAINMDAKGRMAIPAMHRDALVSACNGRIVITAHAHDSCIVIYPEPEWQRILPSIEALPTLNKASLRVQRRLLGYASTLELDGNGRVLVPPTLRDFAKLEKKLMLVGMGKKIELWSEEGWLASVAEVDPSEELPAELLSLSL